MNDRSADLIQDGAYIKQALSGTIAFALGNHTGTMKKTDKIKTTAIAAGYGFLTYLVALSLAWFILARFDFLYGFWHDHAGIKEGIEQYGPQNRYRPGFADTTREQRLELFAAINRAVHNDGDGLEKISYRTPSSNGQHTLLRTPEIIHLNDVAKLLNRLFVLVIIAFVSWPIATYLLYRRPAGLPSVKHQLAGIGLLMAFVVAVLLLFGAENVFNQLHIWVFPKGHQWFFYYQDSLMSTMMMAPSLFGWIALALACLSLLLFSVMQLFLIRFNARAKK